MKDLVPYLYSLLDSGDYEMAKKKVEAALKEVEELPEGQKMFPKIELYGFMIDIGCETGNVPDVEEAIRFFTENEQEIKELISPASYYYNLGNAKHGICKIFYFHNRGVHSIGICREKFQEPIDLYWLAYKNIKGDNLLTLPLLVNLSDALSTIGRIVEGIQMLDTALRIKPDFSRALLSRGEKLDHLSLITNCSHTIALYAQIYLSYSKGIEAELLPEMDKERALLALKKSMQQLDENGFSINQRETELNESHKEYGQHSEYRKFCIDNFLTLNEHSIYCNCIATAKDELQIGRPNAVFENRLLPKLELLLNRMKSEFARWMFYGSFVEEPFDYDVVFSELFEDEIINSQTETLRTSFRICYGILDKVALGICKMYGVEGGNIFFERFWDEKSRKSILEAQRNIHLNALSSIANDLNSNRGELKHFKNWRNKLEHNLLILKDTSNTSMDQFNILADEAFVAIIDIHEFREKALHLLQLTRAAILSFVYCIRLETITKKDPKAEKVATIFTK